ncbi:MAG: flagellar motor switch protein FliN [Opitutales bacterium]|nr:flagellar motor switch protein FliN [Opitutales bacterium]
MSQTYDENALNTILDVRVHATVQLGSCRLRMKEILELSPGAVVQLNQLATDPVGLYLNDRLIAEGEVIIIDDHLGIKITEIKMG